MKKWLDRLADALKRLAGKAAEALPAIVGSLVGVILSFLGKAVRFVAEHTWALMVFAVGLIGWWLMQKVKKDKVFASACLISGQVFFMISLKVMKNLTPGWKIFFHRWQVWPRHKGHHAEYQQA